MLFSFSLDSDFIFGKNAPCQLRRNFKNKSDFFFNYDFSFNRPPLPDSLSRVSSHNATRLEQNLVMVDSFNEK